MAGKNSVERNFQGHSSLLMGESNKRGGSADRREVVKTWSETRKGAIEKTKKRDASIPRERDLQSTVFLGGQFLF